MYRVLQPVSSSAVRCQLNYSERRINNEPFVLVIRCKNNNERVDNCLRSVTKSTKPSTLIWKQLSFHEIQLCYTFHGSDCHHALCFSLSQKQNGDRAVQATMNTFNAGSWNCERATA
jgi:hypothetical protein